MPTTSIFEHHPKHHKRQIQGRRKHHHTWCGQRLVVLTEHAWPAWCDLQGTTESDGSNMQSVSHPLVMALVPHSFSAVAFGNGNSLLLTTQSATPSRSSPAPSVIIRLQENGKWLDVRKGIIVQLLGTSELVEDFEQRSVEMVASLAWGPAGPTLNAVCPSSWSPALPKGSLSSWVSLVISFGPRALEGLRIQCLNSGQPQMP